MKKMIGLLLAAVLLLAAAALLLLNGCAAKGDDLQTGSAQRAGSAPQAGSARRAGSIVVTDFPCYDLVKQVTGAGDGLTLLIRPGTDAHMYEPTPADAMALYGADVFVYIGGHGDGWADDILQSTDGLTVVRLMDSVEALEEEHAHEEHGHEDISYDEHIWTSPVNMRAMLKTVGEALSTVYPGNAELYRANAAAYDQELVALDASFREVVDGAARTELVFADRFPFLYFAREYGLTYRSAFAGCSDDVQPSVQAVASIIKAVEDDGVPIVYVIEMSTEDIARAVREQTGAEIVEMHSCQNVTQREFEAGETYLSLMRRNVEALRKGLN